MTTSAATPVDYGPLLGLIGVWEGDKGLDVAPEPEGSEENPYSETLTFEPAGDVTNAKTQVLSVVRYRQVVRRKSNGEVFHDEIGYWMWDAKTGVVAHSLAIPRALCLLAGGRYSPPASPGGAVTLAVTAKLGDPDWGILQSPFLREKARTTEFRHNLTIKGNRLSYLETTVLEIYGNTFQHTDENELVRQQ